MPSALHVTCNTGSNSVSCIPGEIQSQTGFLRPMIAGFAYRVCRGHTPSHPRLESNQRSQLAPETQVHSG